MIVSGRLSIVRCQSSVSPAHRAICIVSFASRRRELVSRLACIFHKPERFSFLAVSSASEVNAPKHPPRLPSRQRDGIHPSQEGISFANRHLRDPLLGGVAAGRGGSVRIVGNSDTDFRSAFTLLEMLLAVSLMAAVCAITFLTFSVVSSGWQRGMTLSDDLHHGDYVIEQLVMALRSAYYPSAGENAGTYGFWLKDGGSGENASDMISWVKLGGALVGSDCPFAGSPHRVKFSVEPESGENSASVRAWRLEGQPEDFDPDKIEPIVLSHDVTGFNCRVADPDQKTGAEIDWLDEWEDARTNKLPRIVEVTLYMKPLEAGEAPVEIKRVVAIPAAPLSWR